MCGVAGVLRFDGASPDGRMLVRMAESIAHRGPDDQGVRVLGACGLAHRRLSILDLSKRGHQPMPTDDCQMWIAYNGEIYNHAELRHDLTQVGVRFRSTTDTEVLLYGFREWGLEVFERLNGMWAVAIWDEVARRLVLSRDRLGIKPLYWTSGAHRLLFASELKALTAAEPGLARPDDQTVALHLSSPALAFAGRRSFLRHVEQLEPGTTLTVTQGGRMTSKRYWSFSPPESACHVSYGEAQEQVKALLIDSVGRQLQADVRVGTCLSGGIDSSSIVSIISKRYGRRPGTVSAMYASKGFDEREHIKAMRRDMGPGLDVTLEPSGLDVPETIERMTYHQDGPTAGPGLYSQWHVMRSAREVDMPVLLNGQGSDEIFAGYMGDFGPYREWIEQRWFDPITWWQRLGRRNMSEAAPHDDKPPGAILSDDIAPLAHVPKIKPQRDPLTEALWSQTIQTSLPALLHYEDRNSMAWGVESRVPFLDHRLVEFAFSLPPHFKIRNGWTKAIVRDSMRGILPDAIRLRRDKLGYPTPWPTFLRMARNAKWVRDVLLSKSVSERGYVRAKLLPQMVSDHVSGAKDYGWAIWRMMTLELWARQLESVRVSA